MNTINIERHPRQNKDASIKSEDDLVQKTLENLEQKDENIYDLKLEVQSLRYQVRGGNNSHTGPNHNVVCKFKINLPRFDGENNRHGIRWINKIKKYFEIQNIYGDDEKLILASMYMDKTACDYFLWWDSTMKGGRLVRDQDTFKKKFFKLFQDMEETELYNKITHLKQEGIVDGYFSNLLVLATRVQDVTEENSCKLPLMG